MMILPNWNWRVLEWSFWLLQELGITHLYEWIARNLKTHRPLTAYERYLARFVFGEAIDLDKVRIDEHARIGPKQYHLCYVSFNIINSWGKMRDDILIHELVHVWQYQHLGAAYIPRALWAQRTQEGYNYGGVTALQMAIQTNKKFWEFNYEQQGDIVADYFRISHGYSPCWGRGTIDDLWVYEYFMEQVRTMKK
ncbi:MAG: hypothetical protein AAFP82_00945 [Bacteroidota bacterium]